MGRQTRPRNRGSDSPENLRGRLRGYEKNIRQLRKYVKYLENQLGIGAKFHDIEVEETPTKNTEAQDICDNEKCKSTNINYLDVKKFDEPVRIKICADCGRRVVIKNG